MNIETKMSTEGADIFYDSSFRSVLEDHMPLLRTDSSTEVVEVKSNVAYKFERDLFGYLASLETVPHYMFWIIMRVNGWGKDTEFYNPKTILVPHKNTIDRIKQMYEASTTKQ